MFPNGYPSRCSQLGILQGEQLPFYLENTLKSHHLKLMIIGHIWHKVNRKSQLYHFQMAVRCRSFLAQGWQSGHLSFQFLHPFCQETQVPSHWPQVRGQ